MGVEEVRRPASGSPRWGAAASPRSRGARSRSGPARGGSAWRHGIPIAGAPMLDVDADPPPLVRPPGGGPRRLDALRRPHAHRPQRPRRLQADARRSCWRRSAAAGARRSCSRCTSPTATRRPTTSRSRRRADSGGRLVAFCRVDPHDGAASPRRARCLDAGARGIKLHPRAEQFTLHEPGVRELVALAHERARAGPDPRRPRHPRARPGHRAARRGEFPDARLILAHAAISDLAWLWRVLPDAPEPLRRHGVVEPGRPDRPVHARAARADRSGRATRRTGARSTAAVATLRCARPGRARRTSRCAPSPAARSSGSSPARSRSTSAPPPGTSGRARPAAGARRHPPDDGRRPGCSRRADPRSRSRSRGSPARSARTSRARRSRTPCSTCSTSSSRALTSRPPTGRCRRARAS